MSETTLTVKTADFNAIKLSLASPDVIHEWSHGEVLRPETINYRTQKAEKDGLFCEKIFGPTKDWECYCGKYKKIRYKGIVCDKCGVEVTRSIVRRERMGHIDLAAPVTHIWFLRSVPSQIGTILGLSPQSLEKVVYFASFIVTSVDEDLKTEIFEKIREEFKNKKKKIEKESKNKEEDIKKLETIRNEEEEKLKDLKPLKILSEIQYQKLSLKYGHIFEAGIGAEAIRRLLEKLDITKTKEALEKEIAESKKTTIDKKIKRLKLLKNLERNKIAPKWMVLNVIPVIPPDLRPMVPLDGGRYATSDLNDLYRRVINRNNRLKQLQALNAPEIITRNEKRMLQEAIDSLFDNSARQGKTVAASTGQQRALKSLADILKGKQGRFRQNLLGKRVDYSGRSVIVVGPELKLNECGLPKKMALELFKPFVISRLIREGYIHNVRSAARFIEGDHAEVWDILENIINKTHVLLNRAPTLHRLGIQAFKPILIEGKAIQVHPLVCPAFNADFDGDQMAVHVPLTEEAQKEAREIMVSTKNLLKPATGDPVVTPNQDIVWGSYYMTSLEDQKLFTKRIKYFASEDEVIFAYQTAKIGLRQIIKVEFSEKGIIETTAGRILFNQILPKGSKFINETLFSGSLKKLVRYVLDNFGSDQTVKFLDKLKETGFTYLTKSGLSWGMWDLPSVPEKKKIIEEANKVVEEVKGQYEAGLLTDTERHSKIIETWTTAKDEVVKYAKLALPEHGSVNSIISSKARGSWGQLTQMIGMKGLVANPSGEIIELPVKDSFKEGFDVLEYFISTHGSRKGLSDTALRTANAGYLTRRLVDVAQDVYIFEEDCGAKEGLEFTKEESKKIGVNLADRALGKFLLEDAIGGEGKVILKAGELIDEKNHQKLLEAEPKKIIMRSVLECKSEKGVCQKCYGYDLGYNRIAEIGAPVGIVAAQSIGEPGTQLTMRTFHTGGVAGADITQGLPKVEELFEARIPKNKAVLAPVSGMISILEGERSIQDEKGKKIIEGMVAQKILKITYDDIDENKYSLESKSKKNKKEKGKIEIKVKDEENIKKGDILFLDEKGKKIKSKSDGKVKIGKTEIKVMCPVNKIKEFIVSKNTNILVSDGEYVEKGHQLTEGSLELSELHKLKGRKETQKYIIAEIQYVYSSQGQPLNDKHIEIIARQLFSRVYITEDGDSKFLPGNVVDRVEFNKINKETKKEGGRPAKGEELLLGITKVSLSTSSFLSAASFQETSKALIEAALSGKIDHLDGLKENVIIGRLIPIGTGMEK